MHFAHDIYISYRVIYLCILHVTPFINGGVDKPMILVKRLTDAK